MSQVRYPHRATRRLEDLDPLNGPKLYDRIHDDILVAGREFRRDQAEESMESIELLGSLMETYREYSDEAGPFSDLFGEYLECNGETSERNGQIFTPVDVVDMMVQMTLHGVELDRQVPWTFCDPACGTGRFMLRTAKHFMTENKGALNFLFTNADIDRRAFTFCVMNAILNGIPGIHIHGDSLRMEVYEAFATLPVGQVALWERVRPETAKAWLVQSLKTPVPAPVAGRETVQTALEVGA